MREDYVALDDVAAKHRRLALDRSGAYRGKQFQLFKELRENQPENSYLFAAQSEMPTLTTVRSRSFISGSLNNVFEMTSDF